MIFETADRIWIAGQGSLVVPSEHEVAEDDWTRSYINDNPANAYVVGRFVEADRPNQNKQTFSLAHLIEAKPTISYAPMNINHDSRQIVGAFIATEMIHPQGENADETLNPYIEALSAFWRYYFPDAYGVVQKAHHEGALFYSMECLPTHLSTIGGSDDSVLYAYEGRQSKNYPDEINTRSCAGIMMHNPHFVGGALVVPPARPGWKKADVKSIAEYMSEHGDEIDSMYQEIANAAPHLSPEQWEIIMGELLLLAQEREQQEPVQPAKTPRSMLEADPEKVALIRRALKTATGTKETRGVTR